jgi:hypothetical protein
MNGEMKDFRMLGKIRVERRVPERADATNGVCCMLNYNGLWHLSAKFSMTKVYECKG